MTAGNDNRLSGLPPIGSLSDADLVAAAVEALEPLCGGTRLLGLVIAKSEGAKSVGAKSGSPNGDGGNGAGEEVGVARAAGGTDGVPRTFARPEAIDGPRLRLTLTGIAVAQTEGPEAVSAEGSDASTLTVPGLILAELLARSLVEIAGAGVPAGPSYLHATRVHSGGAPALLLTSYFSTGPVG